MIDPLGTLEQAEHEFDLFVRRDFGVAEHLDREMLEVEPHPGPVKQVPHGIEELSGVVVPQQGEELSQLTPAEQRLVVLREPAQDGPRAVVDLPEDANGREVVEKRLVAKEQPVSGAFDDHVQRE